MSHYKLLGVPRNATREVIRAAYLEKAKRYHPDVNQSPQAERLFKAIQEAYQALNNESKQKSFDASNPDATTSNAGQDGPSGRSQSQRPPPRSFRGNAYNPEEERRRFSKDFFSQAEALRREMEAERLRKAGVWGRFRRISLRVLTVAWPYALGAGIIYRAICWWRRRSREEEPIPILRDMYGRAYTVDQFGRRTRAPEHDDPSQHSHWNATQSKVVALDHPNPPEGTKSLTSSSEALSNIGCLTEPAILNVSPLDNRPPLRSTQPPTEQVAEASTTASEPKLIFKSIDSLPETRRRVQDDTILINAVTASTKI